MLHQVRRDGGEERDTGDLRDAARETLSTP
jgi:hypothetical protein